MQETERTLQRRLLGLVRTPPRSNLDEQEHTSNQPGQEGMSMCRQLGLDQHCGEEGAPRHADSEGLTEGFQFIGWEAKQTSNLSSSASAHHLSYVLLSGRISHFVWCYKPLEGEREIKYIRWHILFSP